MIDVGSALHLRFKACRGLDDTYVGDYRRVRDGIELTAEGAGDYSPSAGFIVTWRGAHVSTSFGRSSSSSAFSCRIWSFYVRVV